MTPWGHAHPGEQTPHITKTQLQEPCWRSRDGSGSRGRWTEFFGNPALWLPASKTELALPQLHGKVMPARRSCAGTSELSLLYFQKPTAIKALHNSSLDDKIDMSAAGYLCQREVGSCMHKDTRATQTHWTRCSSSSWMPRKSLDRASCSPSTPQECLHHISVLGS